MRLRVEINGIPGPATFFDIEHGGIEVGRIDQVGNDWVSTVGWDNPVTMWRKPYRNWHTALRATNREIERRAAGRELAT
jgi:hypothetical protein